MSFRESLFHCPTVHTTSLFGLCEDEGSGNEMCVVLVFL